MAKFARLCLRLEGTEARIGLFSVLLKSDKPEVFSEVVRLHGLLILQSFLSETWACKLIQKLCKTLVLIENETKACQTALEFIKLCLQILPKLPVKSRTVLENSKLKTTAAKIEQESAVALKEKKVGATKEGSKVSAEKLDGENSIEDTGPASSMPDEIQLLQECNQLANQLLTQWEKLKDEYKIPKKDISKL